MSILNVIKLHVLALGIFLCTFSMVEADIVYSGKSGEEILYEVDRFRAPDDKFIFDSVIETLDDTMTLSVHSDGPDKGLIVITGPVKQKGRKILYIGRNMWIYVPGTRRALRITPNQQLIGGAATADISRIVYSEDYQVENIKEIGAELQLELKAKNKHAAYAKIELTVDSSDFRPHEAKFFTKRTNRLLKTMIFGGYTNVLGRQRTMEMKIIDHVDNDYETIIKQFDMRLEETPDSWFQPGFLARL